VIEVPLSSAAVRGPERRPQGGRAARALVAGAARSCSGPRRAAGGCAGASRGAGSRATDEGETRCPLGLSAASAPRKAPAHGGGREEKAPRLRLLIALDLPSASKREIRAWGRQALADPALREVPEENLRITLVYLGNRPEREVPLIVATLRDLCEGAPTAMVEMHDPEQRPTRGRPRIYTLPATAPGAEIIQIGLRELLSNRGLYEPEQRPFWPHVTVARVRAEKRGSRRRMSVDRPPSVPLPPSLTEPFWADSVGLYRSDLHPEGARHTLLGKASLSGRH
jgi:RNA 2',3'-cyclic 3'-phosphodiesterase